MTKYSKLPLATFALVLSAFSHAQLAPHYVRTSAPKTTSPPVPTVVFVGDYVTAQWASAFAANPNWINQGNPAPICCFDVPVINMAAVIALHPAYVHIMFGQADAAAVHSDDFQDYLVGIGYELNGLVQQAKAANIKVILGIEPYVLGGSPQQINAVIATFGAANNIPVINYGDALCNCVGSIGSGTTGYSSGDTLNLYGGGAYFVAPTAANFPNVPPNLFSESEIITPTGYKLMTNLAESVIDTMNLTLTTGWLSDVEQPNWYTENGFGGGALVNVNTVAGQSVVQFIPIGSYSDKSQHALINTNFQGASGTWTSSNPYVMYVNQQGLAWALSAGTATIKYTAPNGVQFAPWVMTVP